MSEGYAISRVRSWRGSRKYWAGFSDDWNRRRKSVWSEKPECAVLFVRNSDAHHVAISLNLAGKATLSVRRLCLPSDPRSGEGPDEGNRSPIPPQAVTAGETAPLSPQGEQEDWMASAPFKTVSKCLPTGTGVVTESGHGANACPDSSVTAGETAPSFDMGGG